MLTRTFRYATFAMTLLLAVMWAWSYVDSTGVRVSGWSLVNDRGTVTLVEGEMVSNSAPLWPYSLRSPNNVIYSRHFTCPTALIVLPLAVVSVRTWYHPLRARLSRGGGVGFPVR